MIYVFIRRLITAYSLCVQCTIRFGRCTASAEIRKMHAERAACLEYHPHMSVSCMLCSRTTTSLSYLSLQCHAQSCTSRGTEAHIQDVHIATCTIHLISVSTWHMLEVTNTPLQLLAAYCLETTEWAALTVFHYQQLAHWQ